jgi:hypothetical protein
VGLVSLAIPPLRGHPGIVAALAVVFGLGALIIAIWRGRRVAAVPA